MYVYGKNPVLERIKSDPFSIKGLVFKKGSDLSVLVRAAKERGIHFNSMESVLFKKKFGDVNSQGVVAEVKEFVYDPFDEILARAAEKSVVPVLLDELTDPQNLGSIVRTLACLGGFALVIGKRRCCEVNETVLRVASGGENHIAISQVANMANAVKKLKDRGVWVLGAVAEGGENILAANIPWPAAIIVGSENRGIRPILMQNLDLPLTLSMEGASLSFNVSVAVALLCFELKKSFPMN